VGNSLLKADRRVDVCGRKLKFGLLGLLVLFWLSSASLWAEENPPTITIPWATWVEIRQRVDSLAGQIQLSNKQIEMLKQQQEASRTEWERALNLSKIEAESWKEKYQASEIYWGAQSMKQKRTRQLLEISTITSLTVLVIKLLGGF
jgi:hypothetical protein